MTPLEWTGKYKVCRDDGLCLVLPVPGFPKPGISPEWAHPDFSFGFSLTHAQDQRNLLAWDYKTKTKTISPPPKGN